MGHCTKRNTNYLWWLSKRNVDLKAASLPIGPQLRCLGEWLAYCCRHCAASIWIVSKFRFSQVIQFECKFIFLFLLDLKLVRVWELSWGGSTVRFVFILLYRASTLLANSFLPLALQTTMDWTGLPVALMLLGLDLLLSLGHKVLEPKRQL